MIRSCASFSRLQMLEVNHGSHVSFLNIYFFYKKPEKKLRKSMLNEQQEFDSNQTSRT